MRVGADTGSRLAWLAWLTLGLWLPSLVLMPLAGLFFPNARLPAPSWRPVAWAIVVGPLLLVGGILLYPDLRDVTHTILFSNTAARGVALQSPFALQGAAGDLLRRVLPSVVTVAALGLGSAASMFHATGEQAIERQQIKWGAYASGLAALTWAVATIGLSGSWSVAVVDVALIGLPVGAGIGILKHRLFESGHVAHVAWTSRVRCAASVA